MLLGDNWIAIVHHLRQSRAVAADTVNTDESHAGKPLDLDEFIATLAKMYEWSPSDLSPSSLLLDDVGLDSLALTDAFAAVGHLEGLGARLPENRATSNVSI